MEEFRGVGDALHGLQEPTSLERASWQVTMSLSLSLSPAKFQLQKEAVVQLAIRNEHARPCRNIAFRITFPKGLVLLEGLDVVHIGEIAAGRSTSIPLVLLPRDLGPGVVRVEALSYRDGADRAIDEPDRSLSFVVVQKQASVLPPPPEPEPPPPDVELSLLTQRLVRDSWDDLIVDIHNQGPGWIRPLRWRLTGPISLGDNRATQRVIEAGRSAQHRLSVCPTSLGARAPLCLTHVVCLRHCSVPASQHNRRATARPPILPKNWGRRLRRMMVSGVVSVQTC